MAAARQPDSEAVRQGDESARCEVCGGEARPAGCRQGVYPAASGKSRTFDYWRCGTCGFMWCEAEAVNYDETYWEEIDPEWDLRGGGLGWAERYVLPHLAWGKTVLDLGCGKGALVNALRERGLSAVGVDPMCKGRHPFYRSLGEAELKPGSVGGVVAVELIEHLPAAEARRLLSEVCRLMDPGGRMLISTCFLEFAGAAVPEEWPYVRPPWHVSHYTHEALRLLAVSAGFDADVEFPEPAQLAVLRPASRYAATEAAHEATTGALPVTRGGRGVGRLRVLVLTPYVPYPPISGGQTRVWHLAKELSKNHSVDLAAFAENEQELARRADLEHVFGQVRLVRRHSETRIRNLWRGFPARAHETACLRMESALKELLGGGSYDVLQIEYTEMAHYSDVARGLAKVALTEHDLAFESARRWAATEGRGWGRLRGQLEAARMLAYEIGYCERADCVITVSERDAEVLRGYAPRARIASVCTGVAVSDIHLRANVPQSPSLLFLGYMRHRPNPQALVFFWRRVLPLVARERPEVHLRVVGEGCEWGMEQYQPGAYQELARDERVTVVGPVQDLEGEFARNRIMVAPVLSGSGVRVKILTALAAGIPVVSTTLGVEGLLGEPGRHYLIGDSPEEFADCTLRLLRDDDLCRQLATEGRRLVEEHYDWRVIARQLEQVYLTMVAEG